MHLEARGRILIVDDAEDLRAVLARFLERRGWRCLQARDGLEAVGLFQEGRDFAGVVTDLHMPRLDGLELIAHVRARAPAVPVILLSGALTPEVVADARRRGAVGVLPKGNGFLDVALEIARLLGDGR